MPKNKNKVSKPSVISSIKTKQARLDSVMAQLEPVKKTMRKRAQTRKLKSWIKKIKTVD